MHQSAPWDEARLLRARLQLKARLQPKLPGVSALEDRFAFPQIAFLEAEQAEANRKAKLASPEAVAGREESELKYAHLQSGEAASVAKEVFPRLVEEPAGGPPKLQTGESISRMPAMNVAQVVDSSGKRSVVESVQPMAIPTEQGMTPIDLGLTAAGDAFKPKTPLVGVQIPKEAGQGVSLANTGVSVTPVNEQGSPVGGEEGSIDGALVIYPNTQTDGDTLVKPTTTGFEMDSVVRSIHSPTQLYYKVGMPSGASLKSEGADRSMVIVDEGAMLARIYFPLAYDAEGTPVPVSVEVLAGGIISVALPSLSGGAYKLPVVVDPTAEDPYWSNTSNNLLPEETEGWGGYACAPVLSCPETKAGGAAEENGNTAAYQSVAFGNGEGHGGENILTKASVTIEQKEGPELEFNKANESFYNETTHEWVSNVLYAGHEKWLGPHQGAFGVRAKDPGIGLSSYRVLTPGWEEYKNYFENDECYGIQCPEYNYQNPEYPYKGYTYKTGMPDGEDSFEALAEDDVGLYKQVYPQKIKVDYTPPGKFEISGLRNGNELPTGEPQLTVSATDGEGTTPSSGVKSLKISMEGHEIVGSEAKCETEKGPCTASTKFTLASRDYTTGTHALVATATDNAGNVAQEEFTFRVHGASPVAVGPGSVDPSSGQFTLGASDVSLGGVGGVSRTYESRDLSAGAGGPLGPQWAMGLGGSEALTVSPTGNVVVNAGGGPATFVLNGKGEFESPKGDSNLKLEYKPEEHGEERRYVLKDANLGSETVYEQPLSLQSTAPVYGSSFGWEAGELQRPVSDALDSSGDLWVSDWMGDRILKFSPTGALLGEYGSEGSGSGQFLRPWGIAVNQKTGNVYVSDYSNNRIEEFSSSGAFVKAMGWGVSNGKAEYEICTKECNAGLAGSGAGELNALEGVSIDSSGNIWAVNMGNDRVEEFNEEGGYLRQFGSAGTGAGQFGEPMDVAFAGGNVYVTDQKNDRIAEFSSTGTFIEAFGWGVANGEEKLETCTSSCKAGIAGAGNGQYDLPRGLATDPASGDLYVTEIGGNRVQEVTTSGAFVSKFGSSGSGAGQFAQPMGVVVSPAGAVYVTDFEHAQVQEWSRPGWWPVSAKGALSTSTSYTYASVEGSTGTTSMQPSEILAPAPQGVSCGTKVEELKDGCRALTFKYASETTAGGENESEWGEYKGRLSGIVFHGYNPASKAMEEKPVAQYAYDKQGKLRAEWDPRLEHPLKTLYGYDAEGHVTALTPPGQESWAFVYGASAGDSNMGRLLKVTRAPASAKLWDGEATASSEAPKISGTPAVGMRLGVSNGSWSNAPVAYGYQWEDCNSEGKACAPIAGATNQNYTPTTGEIERTLVVEVTATNGGGSVVASSAASALVAPKAGSLEQSIGGSLTAVSCVPGTTDCVASNSEGGAAYATNVSTSTAAKWQSWRRPEEAHPSEAVACPATSVCLLADDGSMYYATSLGGSWTKSFKPTFPVQAIWCSSSSFCMDGQGQNEVGEKKGYISYSTEPTSGGSWLTKKIGGSTNMDGVFCLSSSFCTAADSTGEIYVATSEKQIESTSWKETDIDGASKLNGIACTSTTSCVAIDGAGNALQLTIESGGAATVTKHDIDGSTNLAALTCTGSTTCVTVNSAGNVFVSKNSGATWTKEYTLGDKLTSVSCASSSLCATVNTAGNVTAFNPAGEKGSEGEYHAPQPGSTIEYNVPVSGAGAPYTLSKEEVEKWGQKDDPVEAAEVFPPDEPQGWPASGHKRATVHYWDIHGRTVNTAIPTGGIATSEYDEANETVRSLGADNRAAAMAEGCVSVSKKECKSAEMSEKLDTKTEYNSEEAGIAKETNILKITGPEHKVKLPDGEEIGARAVTRDYYNEGAKEAEEKTHEAYDLLTKTTSGALLSSGKEEEVRTTATSYSGQEDLGWKLRKPTSVTDEPGGLNLTATTVYSETTGDVVETRSAKGSVSGSPTPPVFAAAFGSGGASEGQFSDGGSVAIDPHGAVWVVDFGNNRLEKFSAEGRFLAAYGSKGSGDGQLDEPYSIAINRTTGDLYVGEIANERVQEFSPEGVFIRAWGFGVSDGKSEFEVCTSSCKAGIAGSGNGQFVEALSLAIDSAGDVWAVDAGNGRVEEFSAEGAYIKKVGSKGSGKGQFTNPTAIAFSGGNFYVNDCGDNRVEEFSGSGAYITVFGSRGSGNGQFNGPQGIATDPVTGDLYVADTENHRVQEFTATGTYITKFGSEGSGNGQFKEAWGVAVNTEGNLYVGDIGNERVQEWQPVPAVPAYTAKFGVKGTENGQLKEPKGIGIAKNGNPIVLDTTNSRLQEFSPTGKYEAKFGSYGPGSGQMKIPYGMTLDGKGNVWVADTGNDRVDEFNEKHEFVQAFGWGVSNGEAKLEVCTSSCQAGIAGAGAGQFDEPKGITVTASGDVYVSDTPNNRVDEFGEKGEFIAVFGFGVSNEKDEFEVCASSCKAGIAGSGNGQFNGPVGIAAAPGAIWVTDRSNNRVEEFNEKDEYVAKFGSVGSGNGQLKEPRGIAISAAGDLWVADSLNNRIEEFTPSGTFLAVFGDKGIGNAQFEEPWGIAFTASGAAYAADSKNNRIDQWTPPTRPGNEAAHDTKTIYYTAKEEAEIAACRNHPEWADMPCQTESAAQPGIAASPPLPVTSFTYNMWDNVEETSEKFTRFNSEGKEETVTRTKAQTYDPAGRALTSEETASPATDTALPKVTNEYNAETGALEKQSATIGGATKTITSKDNTLGQLVEYTDAEGNVARYGYEEGGDGRLEEVSEGKGEEARSDQTYSYNSTTGFMEKLVDSAAGAFTASYDLEGKMVSEVYPNGMCANTTFNSAGQATSLQYIKTRSCAEKEAPVWFSDSIVPSIHGETLEQTSTLAKEKYAYDSAGLLTETQETPAGKDCTSRLYSYDEESNRTSLTTRESTSETCASEGGIVQGHSYDSANRLIDPGMEYEMFGNTTKMPAMDADEHEIMSTYYVDNQVATQTQNEQLEKYTYDPDGRTMETISENEKTKAKSTIIAHYAGSGGALAWTSEGTERWTRDIFGVEGDLAAIQEAGKTAVLQLHDLQGNIIGTAEDSEAATKLLSTYNSTEFGVPQPGTTPPKYAWRGAAGVSSEPSQAAGTSTQSGSSYVPEIGRPLQTGPIASPGSFPDGTGGVGVVNAPYLGSATAEFREESVREGVSREETKKREAEERAYNEEGGCEKDPGQCQGGNCEVNCVTAAGVESQEEGTIEWGSGEPVASAAAYNRSFLLTPGQAAAASYAITAVHHGVIKAPFFPGWANQILSNMPYVKWDKFAEELSAASQATAPLGIVEVTISGSLNPRHFHVYVLVTAKGAEGFPDD